ncbi:MAG: hypothetical protein K2Q15_17110 [Burkholderiales bacterium]|nr:hypothetical protein [Burkholderiales bacterium]
MQIAPTLSQRIADDANLDAAYQWLCARRKDYGHNDDVWDLRYRWAHYKPLIQAQLRNGTYRLGPLMVRW